MQFSAHTNYFQHSFSPHIWNILPSAVNSAPSLSFFKNYFYSLQCVYGHMDHISVLLLSMCLCIMHKISSKKGLHLLSHLEGFSHRNSDKNSLKHCLFGEEPPSWSLQQYWTGRGCNSTYLTKNDWFKPNWLVSHHK